MKTKTLCLFCGRHHPKHERPNLCRAKDQVMNTLTKKSPMWHVFWMIENGFVDLDGEALRLTKRKVY